MMLCADAPPAVIIDPGCIRMQPNSTWEAYRRY